MIQRFVSALVVLAGLGFALPAAAQTPPAQGSTPAQGAAPAPTTASTAAPIVNLWYVGGATGLGVVENASITGNIEAGMRVWKNLDVLLEGGYAGNLATRREGDRASQLAAIIQASQGSPVSASVSVPSSYVAFGARWVFESASRYRPYVLLSVGGAQVNLKPKFALNGADITGSVSNFGVTLGSDISGKYRPFAFGGGVGVLVPLGRRWYADGSIRLLSIDTTEQRTNLARLTVGVGRRF